MVNRVFLIGFLGNDPEVRYTPAGTAIANFNLATNETWLKDGKKETWTEWHRIVAFNKLAEICGEYLAKGKQVYIEGKIQTRRWEDKDGNKNHVTEIVANTVKILGRKNEDQQKAASDRKASSSSETPTPPTEDIDLDDIPF